MPILDPILQHALLNEISGGDIAEIQFFNNYLNIASDYMYNNYNSILASIQFRKDIKKCLSSLCDSFNLDIPSDMVMDMPDCYKFLSQKLINKKLKNKEKMEINPQTKEFISFKSSESSINNIYKNFKYFKILANYSRTWFINDSNTAILCLRMNSNQKTAFDLVPLEIDLLSAVGYTLVLCANGFSDAKADRFNTFYEILEDHRFSEIHINYDFNKSNESDSNFLDLVKKIHCDKDDKLDGFFYIYTQYYQKDGKQYKAFKNYTRPRVNYFYFSDKIDNSLIKIQSTTTKDFDYFIDIRKRISIKVILCNTPLYTNNSGFETDFQNDTKIVTIPANDFLYKSENRVEVTIDADKQKAQNEASKAENKESTAEMAAIDARKAAESVKKYIDFDDLHIINPYFYVKNPLYLSKINSNEMGIINNIIRKAELECQKSKDFKKKKFFSLIKDKRKMDSLKYILYAYKLFTQANKQNFEFRTNQIYVVLKAIDFCISKNSSEKDEQKGFVYQVATGEGKSSIIIMIAAILALSKKTVHVVTSNHFLACRDFLNSYRFFEKIGLKSGVLLHKNEIIYKDEAEKVFFDNILKDTSFENSLGMNIDICMSNVKIIFSTIVNFESLCLYFMENRPTKLNDYYKNCSLVIDEADMILIDELTNGTILSKPMNSNAEEVLTFVYNAKKKNTKSKDLLKKIQENFPKCTDLKLEDIEKMYEEINMIDGNSAFVNGARYSIEDVVYKKKWHKEIFPVNCDKTGVIEKNKEFSGFIQQLIGIKEKISNSSNNIWIKNISMNYLYISHPIFINLYNSVCGLTGTIGNKYDKNIFKKHYKIESKIIPRNSPSKVYEYPIIVCEDQDKRDEQILDEVSKFNKLKVPVLVIFKKLNEIDQFKKRLDAKSLNYQVYDGREKNNDALKTAGEPSSILLGTNICSRGTDIKVDSNKHLHVIISFYTTNKRVMDQAYGRTARNNQFGTVRIICLLSEFKQGISLVNGAQIEKSLKRFDVINQAQNNFINHFRTKREWIFNAQISHVTVNIESATILRDIGINVNRIVAYEYKYPICMSVETFLDIQSQKILSLYNCPNCSYSWVLFQQYLREMILESWSLFINELERKNKDSDLSSILQKEIPKLIKKIEVYLPDKDQNKIGILETFIHIAQKVNENYKCVSDAFKNSFILSNETTRFRFLSFIRLGFRPFSLRDKSGFRIGSLEKDESGTLEKEKKDESGTLEKEENDKIGFIQDPELKYIQSRGKPHLASITRCIDYLFEKIFDFFNDFISNNISMKLFLRRTLGGCEFGICYDFKFEINDDDIKKKKNCLVDTDPLFVFSIHIRSYSAFLAGVLIFLILYLLNLAKKIMSIIGLPLGELAKKVSKEAVEYCVGQILDKAEEKIMNEIVDYLKQIITIQMEKSGMNANDYSALIDWVINFVSSKVIDKAEDIHDFLKDKFKNKFKFNFKLKVPNFDFYKKRIFRLGLLLILCGASYLLLFKSKQAIKFNREDAAKKYNDASSKSDEYDKIKKGNEENIKNLINSYDKK